MQVVQPGEAIEFRLVVRVGPTGWHAAVVGPDATTREFTSPFELARFFAWPRPAPGPGHDGLR